MNHFKICLCTLSVSLSQATYAAEPEPAELDEIVITASRNETKAKDAPKPVYTLDKEQLNQRQARTLPEAMREIPGVNVQKTANGQGSPFIRGFTGFRNLALIDGIRLNNSIFREGPNQYPATVDPFSLERLELVPGQGSVLYGSDSIGGTLNLLTKSSNFRAQEDGFFFHGLTSVRGASAENSGMIRQELQAGQANAWGLHLGASLKTFGDVRGANVGDQPYTGYDEWAYDVRLDLALSDAWTLTAAHQQLQQNEAWRTHSTIYGVSYAGSEIGSDLKRSLDQERTLSYLRLRGEDLEGWAQTISFTLSLQSMYETEYRVRDPEDDRIDSLQTRVRTLGLDLQFMSQTPLGRLTYGVDYYRDYVDSGSQRYTLNGDFDKAGIQGPVGDDSSYDLLGIYLLDEVDFGDRVHLSLGGRYTYAKAEVGRFDNPDTAAEVDQTRDSWNNFSASGQLLIDLDDKDQYRFFIGLAQGFRSPNLSDLSRLDFARSDELEVPSPGLEPEEYLNFEVGIKAQTERFKGSLSYFRTQIDDMIIRRRTGIVMDGDTVVEKFNGGDGYMQGIDFSAEYRLNANWSLFGNLTWTEGEIDQFDAAGNLQAEAASRVVPLIWRAGVRWQTVDGRFWSEFLALAHTAMDRLNSNDLEDTQRIPPGGNPGFTVLTLRGGWEVNEHLGINIALENLADRSYRYAGSGSNEPGFNAILGATIKW